MNQQTLTTTLLIASLSFASCAKKNIPDEQLSELPGADAAEIAAISDVAISNAPAPESPAAPALDLLDEPAPAAAGAAATAPVAAAPPVVAAPPMATITELQAKEIVEKYVHDLTVAYRGAFKIKDRSTNSVLLLEMVRMQDKVERTPAGLVVHVDFQPAGLADRLYDVDFWVVQKEIGPDVSVARIHKEPKRDGDAWTQAERYRFVEGQLVKVQ